MNRDRPVIYLKREAGFSPGYVFSWTIDCAFDTPGSRAYTIEESNTEKGPWKTISPVTSDTVWVEDTRRVHNRDDTKYFRVRMVTSSDVYYSDPVTSVHVVDDRRNILYEEILRREVLLARVHTGIKGGIYLLNRDGAKCTSCTDIITGGPTQGGFCEVCGGTNQNPPYYGPYPAWFTFSNTIRQDSDAEGGIGLTVPSQYSVRVVTREQLKTKDILRTQDTKVLYTVDRVSVTAEVSTKPAVQEAVVNELPTADPLYNLRTFTKGSYNV